jgi:hypothetical protein
LALPPHKEIQQPLVDYSMRLSILKNEYNMQLRSFLTLIALCFCVSLFAQTTAERAAERAKRRTERKAQSKVDNKVDKAVDDAFESIGNIFKKKKKAKPAPETSPENQPEDKGAESGTDAGAFGGMLGNDDSGPYEGFTNEHSVSMDMEIIQTKKNGKSESSIMSMAVTTDRYAIVVQDEAGNRVSQMIFNTQDGKTTMVTTDKNGQKTGFRMKMPGARSFAANAAEDVADRFEFTRTGERKDIDGYNCEKVIVKDRKEGTLTTSWITQDLGVNSKDIFEGMIRALGNKMKTGPNSVMDRSFDGFPIMSTTEDNGKTYVTHFRNIKVGEANIDQSLLDTSGVEIQSLGF